MVAQVIPLGASSYHDNAYGFPSVELENWFAEEAGDRNDRPFRLIPVPGLTSFATGFDGGIRGLAQFDGLLGGLAFVAAGLKVSSMTSAGTVVEVGTISGTNEGRFAASQSDLVMTAGGSAFVVTTSLAEISFPGATGDIVDCAEVAQRHLFLEDGTGRFWWSDVADPSTVPATSFATAESEPDNILAIRVFNDTVLLLGSESTEGWYYTGSIDVPFLPRPGFKIQKGVIAASAVTISDFGLFAVGNDFIVYRFEGFQPIRISTYPIERLIEETTNIAGIRLSSHYWGGHNFIGLHIPGIGDYFYDSSNGTWHRRKELNSDRYLVQFFIDAFGKRFAGGADNSTIYRLDRDVFTHDTNTVRRVATTIIPVEDGRPAIDNITVEMQAGVGLSTGQGSDPEVMLSFAKDGRHFSNEIRRSFGKQGEFDRVPLFGSLGRFRPPAAKIRIAVSDPVPATVTALILNRNSP